MTITIELPEETASRLATLSPSDRARLDDAVRQKVEEIVFATAPNMPNEDSFDDAEEPLTQEDIEALRISFAQADAGQLIDGDEFLAQLGAELEAQAKAKR